MPARLLPSPALEQMLEDDVYIGIRSDPEDKGFCEYLDQGDFVHEISGMVALFNTSGEPMKELGRFIVKQLDVDSASLHGFPAYDVFDLSASTWTYYEYLYDHRINDYARRVLRALKCEDEYVSSNLLIIDRLELWPEFRGLGIGLRAMACLLTRYRIGSGLAAIKPFPLQFEGDKKDDEEQLRLRGYDKYKGDQRTCTRRLAAHYSRLGFLSVPRTPFMCLPLIERLPS